MSQGTWDSISMESPEKLPKVKFDIGNTNIITVLVDRPREVVWEDGTFYVFDCIESGEKKCIVTSAWSLIRGLKSQEPLNGKTLKIAKLMEKGKQTYKVSLNEERL